MEFNPPLQSAHLIKRYKRFLADLRLADGRIVTVHCPNTGSMLNCQDADSLVWYSTSDNPARKYSRTWELVENHRGERIGINTGRANALVKEAIEHGVIPELQGYQHLQAEVPYGQEQSRIDFLLQGHRKLPDCYVEVKNVSLAEANGLGFFPDAVTQRGQKHLRELMALRRQGLRALLLFCVQHTGVQELRPADHIDPEYGRLLREAAAKGVELLAYRAALSPSRCELKTAVVVKL